MDVSPSPRTPDHQAVPVLCTPNYGVCQPSLAWLHTWRGCPTAREDPGCSRPLHPPSSVAHTQKWTTPSSRLAITLLAAWNRKFVSAPSLSQPSTRATDKLPTTLCLFSQSAIPEEAKATDSSCSPDNETHHLFLLQRISGMEHSPRTHSKPNKCWTIQKSTHQTLLFAKIYLK